MLNGFTNCGRGTVKFCWNTATVICFHIIWLLFHCPWHSPGKKTGSPPPGIFPPQGLNRSLVHCGQIPYHLSHQGNSIYVHNISHILSYLSNSGNSDLDSCINGDCCCVFSACTIAFIVKLEVRNYVQNNFENHGFGGLHWIGV